MTDSNDTGRREGIVAILGDTFREWRKDDVSGLGAALAYYGVLSVGQLLLIVIYIAGLVFGREAASGQVFGELRGLLGNEGAEAIQAILASYQSKTEGFWPTVIGLGTLVIAAMGFFGQLQTSLNIIWKVDMKTGGFLLMLRRRLFSFAMILGIGLLLLMSLAVSAGLEAFGNYFSGSLPVALMYWVNMVISFGVITLLFAMIFKILPDVNVRWRDVWVGAAITSVLFSVGKYLIGIYLGHSAFSSTYGAAGSLIVVLVWIYYSSQILFLGAEFTQVRARYAKKRPLLPP